MTQKQKVLDYLVTNKGGLTQKECIELFKAYRLSAIIYRLRDEHVIDMQLQQNASGKGSHGRYFYKGKREVQLELPKVERDCLSVGELLKQKDKRIKELEAELHGHRHLANGTVELINELQNKIIVHEENEYEIEKMWVGRYEKTRLELLNKLEKYKAIEEAMKHPIKGPIIRRLV